MYNRILIPTDGSRLAARGIDHGLGLAKALGIPASVVTVAVPLAGLAFPGLEQAEAVNTYNDSVNREVKELERQVQQRAAKAGVSIEFLSETNSSPATAILETAQRSGCDLIVMSSHGRRGIKRIVLGSQTAEVLASSTIPVLVVK
jgi:nucleotide-binding universal stress UspA family protein